ncbi:MAG: hypothetical protein PWQ06_912 [Anaerophaga sp.]|jgi:hypothetical protein|nr:hypothetical protein [Anaerophaga sp.]MDN5296974.1 hypothetical protein [Bacteroidota bacterium]
MKRILFYSFLALFSFIVSTCQEKSDTNDYNIEYIKSVEVISPHAEKVVFDNFAHFISIDFPTNTDITDVKMKLTLAPGVKMENPREETSQYDLSKEATLEIRHGERIILFRIKSNFVVTPPDPSAHGWEKKNDFERLPAYLSVYKYTRKVEEKNVQAYIAIADMNNKEARFSVLGEAQGTQTPSHFFNNSNKPVVLLNGGYFWDGHSLGLIVRDGKTVNPAEAIVWRNYNGKSTAYYPTRGIFGLGYDGKFYAHWAYQLDGKLFVYPSPAPNKAGEKPQDIPSDKFPQGAQQWTPKDAIGAGPVLIKNGEYKNTWENELFDSASGIGPTINNPRSAIGYAPSGHLIFFVCEGRNKTPDTPGLTLKNVADLLLDLGCTEALNLDGGGSSCMLINGKETIIPSDGKQRSITSMVALY